MGLSGPDSWSVTSVADGSGDGDAVGVGCGAAFCGPQPASRATRRVGASARAPVTRRPISTSPLTCGVLPQEPDILGPDPSAPIHVPTSCSRVRPSFFTPEEPRGTSPTPAPPA